MTDAGRGLFRLPRQRHTSGGDGIWSATSGRSRTAAASTRRACRRQHPETFRLAAGAEEHRDFTDSSSGPPISTRPVVGGGQGHQPAGARHQSTSWRRSGVAHFPPAPLGLDGKLDPRKFKKDSPEMRGRRCSSGRPSGQACHPAPYYTTTPCTTSRSSASTRRRRSTVLVARRGRSRRSRLRASRVAAVTLHDAGCGRWRTRWSFST